LVISHHLVGHNYKAAVMAIETVNQPQAAQNVMVTTTKPL